MALVKAAVTGNFDHGPKGMEVRNMDLLQALLGAFSIKDEIKNNPAVAAMINEAGGIQSFMREFGSEKWDDPALIQMAEKYKAAFEQMQGMKPRDVAVADNYKTKFDQLKTASQFGLDKTIDMVEFWGSTLGNFLKSIWGMTHVWPILKAIPGQCLHFYNASQVAKANPNSTAKVMAFVFAFLELMKFITTGGVMTGLAGKIATIFNHELGLKMLAGSYLTWGIVSLMAKHDHSEPHGETICDKLLGTEQEPESKSDGDDKKIMANIAAKMIAIVVAGLDPSQPIGLLNRQMAELGKKQSTNETTLHGLHNSAVAAFPNTTRRQHVVDEIKITRLEWIPYLGMKTLYLRGLAQNTENGHEYRPIILFKGVQYANPDEPDSLQFIASDGKQYFIEGLGADKNHVMVRCECKDFYWRFTHYDHLDRSLYGRNRRRYEGTTGIKANPSELPGMCKHLMAMAMAIQDAGLIIETKDTHEIQNCD